MFKKIFWITLLLVLVGGLVFGAVNRTLAKNGHEDSPQSASWSNNRTNVDTTGNVSEGSGYAHRGSTDSRIVYTVPQVSDTNVTGIEHADLPPASVNGLTEAEISALSFIREEEKLAHDVYSYLYERWNQPTFQNIAVSEQTHTQAVLELLERYDLPDPASQEIGIFTNPDLQQLYDQLTSQGSQSLPEALKVGAAIEEIDILDLDARLEQIVSPDIQQVFENLRNGSSNHLRAFTRVLSNQTGETYHPQYLTEEAYQAFLGTAQGNGRGGYRGSRP